MHNEIYPGPSRMPSFLADGNFDITSIGDVNIGYQDMEYGYGLVCTNTRLYYGDNDTVTYWVGKKEMEDFFKNPLTL